MAEREPASISTIPLSTQSPREDRDKAFTKENLPTRRNACSQCNECFRQQYPFPFPQNCSLPIPNPPSGVGMGLTAPNSEPLLIPKAIRICRFPKHGFGESSSNSSSTTTTTNAREKRKERKKNQKQWGGKQKLGLVSDGEINPVFFFLQWGAGAFPALALIRSVHEPSLYFIFSWNPKRGPKIRFASFPIYSLLKPLALLR